MWSTPLLTASIGTRATGVQVRPSVEVLITRSLTLQPLRKRQSCQTAYTLPAASISAEGSGSVRTPATACVGAVETAVTLDHVTPPLVERYAMIVAMFASAATMITSPSGCTTGWPPIPGKLSEVGTGVLHVSPPSVE